LFHATQGQGVKPPAWVLLKEFGDFNSVISAPEDIFLVVKGLDVAVLQKIKIT
jgi:hypothetical protein